MKKKPFLNTGLQTIIAGPQDGLEAKYTCFIVINTKDDLENCFFCI